MNLNNGCGSDELIQELLKQAESYAKQEQHAKAIEVFEQILAAAPKNESALVGKIKSLRSLYRFDQAEEMTRQALGEFPESAKFLNQEAYLYFDKHQYDEAIELFERILNDYSNNEEAWEGKIKSLISQYRFDQAEEAIRNALRELQRNVKILNQQVRLYYERGQYAKAIEVCNEILNIDLVNEDALEGKIATLRSLNRFSEAEQFIQDALNKLPQKSKILNQQGYLYAEQRQYKEAIKVFDEVLKNKETGAIDTANAFEGKITSLRSLGQLDRANQTIQECLDQPDKNPALLNNCGWFYFGQGQYDKAVQVFQQTIHDFPYDEDAWVGKIVSLQRMYHFKETEEAANKALEKLPQSIKILDQKSYLYRSQGQYEKALGVYQEIIGINSSNIDALEGKLATLRSLNRFPEAEQVIQDALNTLPQKSKIQNQQGYLYAEQRQYREAIEVFDEVLENKETSAIDTANAFEGKITSLRSLGQLDRANQTIQKLLDRPDKNPALLNKCGGFHFGQGQYDKAIQAFQRTLDVFPYDEEAWVGKIVSLRFQCHFDEAEQVIRKALTQLPQSVRILSQRGYLYTDKQQYEQAIKVFDQTIHDFPYGENAWVGKIFSWRQMYHFKEAEETANKALEKLPQSIEILNQKSELYRSQGQYDNALRVYEEIIGINSSNIDALAGKVELLRSLNRFPEAEQVIQDALNTLPQKSKIQNQQGYLYAEQRQYREAIEVFDEVLENKETSAIDTANAFEGKITSLRSLGQLDRANQTIQKLLDRPDKNPALLNKCGGFYFGQGQYDKAIQAFQRTLDVFPYDEEAWVGKIVSLRFQCHFDEAEQVIRKALTQLPQSVRILSQRGYLYTDKQQYEQAIKVFDQTIHDFPYGENAWVGKIFSWRQMYHFKEAEETANKALEKLPQSIEILNQKSELYRSQGQYDNALRVYEEIIGINSSNIDALAGKVELLRWLNRFPEAEQVIQDALNTLPQKSKILNQQGYLYAEQQEYRKAIEAFDKVLNNELKNEPTSEIDTANAFEGKIKSLQSLGQLDRVNQTIQKFLDRPDKKPALLNKCGWFYFGQGQYDKAIQAFQQTLNYFHDNHSHDNSLHDHEYAWIGRIISLRFQDPFGQVHQIIETASKIFPESPYIQNQHILLHLEQGKYDDAIQACKEVLEIAPFSEMALWGRIEALRNQFHFADAIRESDAAREKLPDSVRILNKKGKILLQQRKYDQAFRVFRKTLEVNQTNEEAVIGKIRAKCQNYRFDEAEDIVNKALLEPFFTRNSGIWNEKGQLYISQRKYDLAIQAFEQTLNFAPIDEDALAGRISAWRLKHHFDKTSQFLQKALEQLPNSPTILYEQALFYLDRSQFDLANDCLKKASKCAPTWTELKYCQVEVLRKMKKPWEALKILKDLEELFPSNLEVKAKIGWWYIRRNQPDKAKKEFDLIGQKNEENIEQIDGLRAVYLRQGKYEEARINAKKANKNEPKNPYFLANLAQVLLLQDEKTELTHSSGLNSFSLQNTPNLDEAEKCCQDALKIDPHNETALGCLGAIAFKKKDYVEAEDYLCASIKESPKYGNYTGLGTLYAYMYQYEEAEKTLKKAIELDYDDTQAYIELGNLYLKVGRVEEAITTFKRASSVDQESAEAQQAIALAFMQKSEFDQAEKALHKALNLNNRHMYWELELSLVQILIGRGDQSSERGDGALANHYYSEALAEVKQIVRSQPDRPEAYFLQGIIQFQLKDYKGASKSFQTCKNIDPDGDYACDAARNTKLAKSQGKSQIIPQDPVAIIGYVLGMTFLALLIGLWVLYLSLGDRTINETTLTIMSVALLGLIVVAVLLPSLSLLKLPGGFEAELTRLNPPVEKNATPDSVSYSVLYSATKSLTSPKENRVTSLDRPRLTSSSNQHKNIRD